MGPFPASTAPARQLAALRDISSRTARLPLVAPDPATGQPAAFPKIPLATGSRLIARERAYGLCSLLLIGDWIAACAAIFAGLELRDWQNAAWILRSETLFDFRTSPIPWSLAGGTLFIWLMVMFKTYDVLNLYRMRLWAKNLIRSVSICAVVAWAYIGLFQATGYTPRIGVAYCIVTLVCFGTLWRLTSFVFLIQPDVKVAASTRIIVVGWNEKVAQLRKAMRRDLAQLGEIIGCVPMPGGAFASKPPAELAVLGDYPDLPRIIAECSADSIILSNATCSAREIQHLIQFCQRETIGFQMVPEYFPALNSGLRVQTLSGVPLLGVSQLPLDRTLNRMIKRVMDIVGALAGLCIGAVLIPFFGFLVYLESPGPMFRRERRASRSGRIFYINKIRTSPLDTLCPFSVEEEPRKAKSPLLKIGKFMQKHDIDELPQFWNVLVGDMSLVGPHPESPEAIEKLRDEIPNYNARHEVRAGLTGLAQINEIKGDTNFEKQIRGNKNSVKRIDGDLYYLENWSLTFDIYCIVATLFRDVCGRQGAPDTEM